MPHQMSYDEPAASLNGRYHEPGNILIDGYEGRIPSTQAQIQSRRDALAVELEIARMVAHRCDEAAL